MTQSPPKASSSTRPPAPAGAIDGARLMTALAAGGSVLLLSITAVALWPRTYGTEATLVLDGGARVDNPVALAGRIEAALLERDQLASAAMELPPELRSPDPIGRLRAGIRVQSRAALGFTVEFRGSDPQSVQRIANRLADRAVALVPKLTTSPDDAAPLKELAQRSRAVSEFLTAHPEMTLEQPTDKPAGSAPATTSDSGLDLLRTEKRQIEQKLASGAAVDNPYADPGDDVAQLNRRLAELKNTIAKREAALKQPRPATPPAAGNGLAAQWRSLLTDLATAQAKAAAPSAHPLVTAHVAARASLPSSPLTPNRLVLTMVALLLSLAAAMVAYILPRKAMLAQRLQRDQQRPQSDPPPALNPAPGPRSDAPPAMNQAPATRSDPPPKGSDPPPKGSDPPPKGSDPPPPRPGSEPPGPMAPQRTVVLTSATKASPEPEQRRRSTNPGGLEAPTADALATTALATVPKTRTSPPPSAPLFGSRPPPGAGSYSVSSSHPPPMEGIEAKRTTVERLSPLQSAHPPAASTQVAINTAPARSTSPVPADGPQIMSRPPALDPEAERWAAHFDAPPPVEEEAQRKRSGRWKTQVMGSMVPLEVSSMREERPPPSDAGAAPASAPVAARVAAPVEDRRIVPVAQPMQMPPSAELVLLDVPAGWRPNVDPTDPQVVALRDAVLSQGLSSRLRIAVTGSAGNGKAQVAAALSVALAQTGARVLLVEADFDHPQVHQSLAIDTPSGAGFSQQILARRNDLRPRPWVVVSCMPTLQVLAEGRFRSPGLLDSNEFERALRELGEQHHVVVIHAPAIESASDLRAIDALSHAAVIIRAKQPAAIQFGNNPLRSVM